MEHQVGNMKCFHPQTFNDNIVSCGRCPACKQNRINGWVCRLERHARVQASAIFVTLTYADGQCTKTPHGLLTLDYTHVQHFFKSLRNIQNADYKKQLIQWQSRKNRLGRKHQIAGPGADIEPKKPEKFSYYVAGEYGSKGKRPHYHIILFNATIECIHRAWCINHFTRRQARGNVHTGTISGASIRYTLKYINKPSRLPQFQGDDRTPEFSHMSQGIGKDYITTKIISWHRQDLLNRYYVPGAGGVQITMPRYYAEKIYTPAERIQIGEYLEKKSSQLFLKQTMDFSVLCAQVISSYKAAEKKAFTNKANYSQLC